MINMKTPLGENDVRRLNVGDIVLLNGTIFTARDRAHVFFLENDFKKINGSVIYHCGPIVKQADGSYSVVSAGPTTSTRLNKYTPALIERYSIKAIIGKGGMDSQVLEAMRGKAVYLAAIGGAGVLYADAVSVVKGVHKPEFGMPEAIWELQVKDFPVVVTMDSKGNSLHEEVLSDSRKALDKLIR